MSSVLGTKILLFYFEQTFEIYLEILYNKYIYKIFKS